MDSGHRLVYALLFFLGIAQAGHAALLSQTVAEVSGTVSTLNPPASTPFSVSTVPFTFASATITGIQNFSLTVRGVSNPTSAPIFAQVYLSGGVTQPDPSHYLLNSNRLPIGGCLFIVPAGANQDLASVCRVSASDDAALLNASIVNIYSTAQNFFVGLGPEAAALVFSPNSTVTLNITPAPLPALQFYMSAGGFQPFQQTWNLPPFTVAPTLSTSTTLGSNWLSASLSTSGSGGTITATVNPSGLAPAVYSGSAILSTAGGTTVPVPITFAVQPSTLQYVQQGGELVVTNTDQGGHDQGVSVSVTQDGNTLLTGANVDVSFTGFGSAWLYRRSAGIWSVADDYYAPVSGPASQGSGVAISPDGSTVLWGGPGLNNNTGAAWVTGGPCAAAELVASDPIGNAQVGSSVALSADGLTAILGGTNDNNAAGAAWVFVCSQGIWQQQAKLVGYGAGPNTYHGQSVALSADGNTALVGKTQVFNTPGEVWVFTRSGDVWTQQAQLTAKATSTLGRTVNLTPDGNTALISAGGDHAAWLFQRSGTTWASVAELSVGTGGYTAALAPDGNTAVVAAQTGAYVFTNANSSWNTLGPLLTPLDGNSVWYAETMAFSGDGSTLIIGDFLNGTIGGTWAFVPSYLPPALNNISPGANTAGSTFLLTASGSSFMKGAAIQVNGSTLPTTFVSASQLTAQVPAEVSATIGNFPVIVINPDGSSSSPSSLQFTQPALKVSSTHTGNFVRGRQGVYQITVSNPSGALNTTPGISIAVVDQLPANLTAVSISGQGWNCTLNNLSCVRSDVLTANTSFPPIQLTVNVGTGGSSSPNNIVIAQGGGFALASAIDTTTLVNAGRCDINGDQVLNLTDIQLLLNELLGQSAAVNDINSDGVVNVTDLQILIGSVVNNAVGCGS